MLCTLFLARPSPFLPLLDSTHRSDLSGKYQTSWLVSLLFTVLNFSRTRLYCLNPISFLAQDCLATTYTTDWVPLLSTPSAGEPYPPYNAETNVLFDFRGTGHLRLRRRQDTSEACLSR